MDSCQRPYTVMTCFSSGLPLFHPLVFYHFSYHTHFHFIYLCSNLFHLLMLTCQSFTFTSDWIHIFSSFSQPFQASRKKCLVNINTSLNKNLVILRNEARVGREELIKTIVLLSITFCSHIFCCFYILKYLHKVQEFNYPVILTDDGL